MSMFEATVLTVDLDVEHTISRGKLLQLGKMQTDTVRLLLDGHMLGMDADGSRRKTLLQLLHVAVGLACVRN